MARQIGTATLIEDGGATFVQMHLRAEDETGEVLGDAVLELSLDEAQRRGWVFEEPPALGREVAVLAVEE